MLKATGKEATQTRSGSRAYFGPAIVQDRCVLGVSGARLTHPSRYTSLCLRMT